jgi:hypothetical protein
MVLLFGIFFFLHHVGDMTGFYKTALGLWWEGKFVPLVASAVNLVLNILLVQTIGLAGILLSTILSVVCVYTPWGSWILFRYYFKDVGLYKKYLLGLVKYFVIALVVSGVTLLICSLGSVSGNWLLLIKNGVICVFVPNLLLLLFFSHTEVFQAAFSFVKNIVQKKLGKREAE